MKKKTRIIALLFLFPMSLYAQEICDNGIDDDGDGLIDLNDSDCDCDGFETSQNIPSLIPNPSFEDNSCCPSTFSELHCADDWIQATDATSDYFNCGYSFGSIDNAGLTPPPDGNAFVGAIYMDGYMEYVGSCLQQPLIAGDTYILSFDIASLPMGSMGEVCSMPYGDVDVTIYGSNNCGALPVFTSTCPSNASAEWDVISVENYSPDDNWDVITFEIVPTQDINAIMIGAPCNLPPSYPDFNGPCYPYFIYDNLILASSSLFNPLSIDQQGSICSNDLILEASADSVGGDWQWYFEGEALVGETSEFLDVSALGLGDGEYNAMYTIGTNCEIVNHTVDPAETPTADFQFNDVCLTEETNFIDESSISTTGVTIDNWTWDFDDGNSSSSQNPNHTYTDPGTYDVKLIVEASNGCMDSITQSVEVFPSLEADFSFERVCVGNATNFLDLSDVNGNASINDWQWSFGDGGEATVQNPTHTYQSSGEYDVSLTVSIDGYCQDFTNQTISVYAKPRASFKVLELFEDLEAEFTNTSTINETYGDIINQWEWSFGDGSSSSIENPLNAYDEEGEYEVSLVVTSNNDCVDSAKAVVEIYERIIFYVPNTFTPDGDGFNETFQPIFTSGYDPQDFNLLIFNRWGEIVFESNNADIGWDGTYGEANNKTVKEGAYVWKIEFKETMSDKRHSHVGHLNVLK